MKLRKIFRAAAAVISAAVMCVSLAGCSFEFGISPDAKDKEIAARPTGGENTEGMEVTYGEFRKQYTYLLNLNGIEDDTASDVAEAWTKQRNNIINNLITNKIILHKAQEMGISLTEEDLEDARKIADEQIEQQIEYFSGLASYTDLGTEEITDEIRRQRGSEELDKFLEKCGMTRDDLFTWTKEYLLSAKVLDETVSSVTRADAEAKVREMIGKMQDIYKTDPAAYEQSGYSQFWVPEGSRLIKHVLVGFDESLQTQILISRSNGDDENADKLRADGAKELEEKVAEVQKKLDEMNEGKTTFNEIILEYSADSAGSSAYPDGYVVVPNGESYAKEFQEAAFVPEKIGDRTVCVTDFGVHVMIYAGDAKADPDSIEAFTQTALGEMKNEEFQIRLEEWKAVYAYETDRELLRLDYKPETSDTSNTSDASDTDSSDTANSSTENGSSTTE